MLKSFLLSIIILHSIVSFSQKKNASGKPDKWDSYIENWRQKDSVPGIFLMIAKDGKVLKEKGYGYANLEFKTTPQATTVFETGSITNMFTALGIAILWEQGKLHPDSSITKYIDSLPSFWNYITVRHLLYHSHGLNPEHFDYNMLHSPANVRYTVREQQYYLMSQRQYSFTGKAAYFSNSAFFLLGVIIQHLSGTTYNDFIQKNIFNKAGMSNSSFIDAEARIPDKAQGYTLRKGKWIRWSLEQNLQSLDCNSFAGILSSPGDMLLFDKVLLTNSLVKKETYQQMLKPFILVDGSPAASGRSNWGMGCLVREINGFQSVSLTGTAGTAFYRFPNEGLCVILFTNLGQGNDFVKDKGADMLTNGYKLAEEAVAEYLLKK